MGRMRFQCKCGSVIELSPVVDDNDQNDQGDNQGSIVGWSVFECECGRVFFLGWLEEFDGDEDGDEDGD